MRVREGFTSQTLDRWAYVSGLQMHFITPGHIHMSRVAWSLTWCPVPISLLLNHLSGASPVSFLLNHASFGEIHI
jgi:hypothetical protein